VIEFALLRIVEGPREAKELKIPAGTAAVLGRGEDCWEILDLQDLTLGRHHCRLAVEKTRVYLEDLHSLNGTFVNSQRVDPAKGPVPLSPGDMIRIGKSTLCLGLGLAASCGACGHPVRLTIHLDFGGQASETVYCRQCWDAASQVRAGGTATARTESMGGAGSVEDAASPSETAAATVLRGADLDSLLEERFQTVLEIPSARGRRTLVVKQRSGRSRHVVKIIPAVDGEFLDRMAPLTNRLRSFRHPGVLVWEELRLTPSALLAVRPYLRKLSDSLSSSAADDSSSSLNFQTLLPRLLAVTETLSALHAAGLTHGNLGFSNVDLDLDRSESPKPRCLLIDYGLEALAAEAAGRLIPFRAAAEQDVRRAIDLFGQLLTGGEQSVLDRRHPASAWLETARKGDFPDAASLLSSLRGLQSTLVRLTFVK
jgi:hypothetical protein